MIKRTSQTPREGSRIMPMLTMLLAFAICLGGCCKDDPQPGPGPGPGPGPNPPEPPTPPVPEAKAYVPLTLEARPEGDDAPLWQKEDTLQVILTETGGTQALGDTAFYRYICAPVEGEPYCFAPATARDTAFLPSDSSKADLLVYRPALIALDRPTLHLTVDAPRLTALGYPLMTAPRQQGLHLLAPLADVTLCHRLARLSVSLTIDGEAKKSSAPSDFNSLESAQIILNGNPSTAVWGLPEEAFILYGDTVSQYFNMRADGTSGYLYAIPSAKREPDGDMPSLSLTVCVPNRQPIEVSLDNYLPSEGLNSGLYVDITIEIPEKPSKPDRPDYPDYPVLPIPPDPNIVRVTVTLSDWENIIYESDLYPDSINN